MAENRQDKFRELYDAGIDLLKDGKDKEAMELLWQAANTSPEGWLNLATELIKDKQHDLALERLKEVLLISKDHRIRSAASNNIGMIFAHKGQRSEAMACFHEAVREWPAFPDSYSNIGLVHKWSENYSEAMRWVNRALKIDPWHEQAQFVRAMILLLDGDYDLGFKEYECRWRSRGNGLQKIVSPVPEWNGKNGSHVFIYGEQGNGDTILMLRYAKAIREMGVHQFWITHKGMSSILRTIPEIDLVCEHGDVLPDFDCHLPAVSLPFVMGTRFDSIPASPYLPKPNKIDLGPGFHVGISWRGSHVQGNDSIRSTRLEDWLPVLNVPGVTFHSLQVDHHAEGLLYHQIEHHHATPTNWMETAQLVSSLDLVVSVDTALVHLAGALGVPCWCALHCRPYFVYPPKTGEKTPWYESVKLYRQKREFEWKPIFKRIANDLCNLTKS